MLTLFTFIAVLSILVFVHELGHFWTAIKFGIRAEEFGFGIPPRIWGIYKKKDGKWKQVWGSKEVKDAKSTIYSLNWIPMGGFVKIKGEDGEGADDKDSFSSRPVWQRFTVLSAGVFMNIVLAAVLISIGLMIGFPQALDGIDSRAEIRDKKVQIARVLPDSPADNAELQTADVILSINGQTFTKDEELQEFVGDKAGQELTYEIKRGDKIIEKRITPELREDTGQGGIGVAIVTTGLVKYPWYLAIYEGFTSTIILTGAVVMAFVGLFKDLFAGNGLAAEVAGPVGIANLTGQVARMGFLYLIQFSAMLSINLAVLNFLPFPGLDGGRVFFLAIEKIKGSPVRRELEGAIHGVGLLILMILVLAVTFKDILNFWN